MKKLFLTSALALCISCPAFANIDKDASTATCDNTTIGTTTGPANLQADWTANTINLDWYDGDTKLTVGTSSATCTYDDSITLPSTPTVPTGYTFGGWRVKVANILASLNASIDGSAYGYSRLNGNAGENESTYGLTVGSGEWATEFEYGTIKGMARCSTQRPTTQWYVQGAFTSDHFATDLDDQNGQTGAVNCWCKATGFAEPHSNNYAPVSSSSWVFLSNDNKNPNECTSSCAADCSSDLIVYSLFRSALYGITQ